MTPTESSTTGNVDPPAACATLAGRPDEYAPRTPPTVTVVLPVYNGAAWVREAIESIRSQTFTDWNLHIVDDGSSDASLGICQAAASADPRISVASNPQNLGLAKTMNRLVGEADGEFVAVQEQDDVSVPERLELEVDLLRSDPEIGLVCGVAAWVDDHGETFAHFPGILFHGGQYPQDRADMVRYLYVNQCKVANATSMFRRSVCDGTPAPFDADARMSIDWRFALDVAHRHRIFGIPVVLARMRRGAGHASLTSRKDLQFREARRCIRRVFERYSKCSDSPIDYRLYRRAMAGELVLEGRFFSGSRGARLHLQAILSYPFSGVVWRSAAELAVRRLRRALAAAR